MLPLAVMTAAASPVVGALADKRPARWLFAAGLAGVAVFCLGVSMAQQAWHIWVLYGLIYPVFLSLSASITANAVVSRWFVKRLGLALGITAFGSGVSGVVLPPLIAALMPDLGWRAIWRIAAGLIAFVVLPLALTILRDHPTERDGLDYVANGEAHRSHHGGGANLRWVDIAKRRNFWLLASCRVPVIAAYGGIQTNLAPIAASHGFGQGAAGMLLAVVQPVLHRLNGADGHSFGSVRQPRSARTAGDRRGGRDGAFGFASTMPALFAAAVLVGFGGGLWTLLPAAVATEFGAAGVGRAFGMLMLFLPLNAAVSPTIAGVKESTGSYAPAMLALAAVTLIGGLLVLLMRERRGGRARLCGTDRRARGANQPDPVIGRCACG